MQKILILLSTYNGERYLEEQLNSIRNQCGVEPKVCVRDDGSSDATISILQKYKSDYPDLFEEIIAGDNIGSTASFRNLMKLAYAKYGQIYEYFAFADQDDYWIKEKLSVAVHKLERLNGSEPNMYCSDKMIVDSELNKMTGIRPAKVSLSKGRALARNIATGCTMVFNRRALELFVTHDPEFIIIHDYIIFLICTFLGKVVYDENAYILYRQHGKNQLGGLDTFRARIHDRLRKKGNLHAHSQEKSAIAFYAAYETLLSADDKKLISIMMSYRNSFADKLKLLFNKEISKERLEDNLFFKIKILLSGV